MPCSSHNATRQLENLAILHCLLQFLWPADDAQAPRLRSMAPQGFSKAAVAQAPFDFGAEFSVALLRNSLFMEFLPWGKWALLQSQKVIFA